MMIGFTYPFVLSGLILLPALWWLLRVMPPIPRNIYLPTTRFFAKIPERDATPVTTPLWLLILRTLMLAFLIIAFAHPVLNPRKESLGDTRPLHLIFDNSWASAQTWDVQKSKAEEILKTAARQDRAVLMEFTADRTEKDQSLSRADEALARLSSATPRPMPNDLSFLSRKTDMQTVWISTGLSDDGFESASIFYADNGGLTLYMPEMRARPNILRGPENDGSAARIEIPTGVADKTVTLQGFDAKSRLRAQMNISVSGQSGGADIPDTDKKFFDKEISSLRMMGVAGAGGVWLRPLSKGSAVIGIPATVSGASNDGYEDAAFYLKRAVEKFATVEIGTIDQLLEKKVGILFLPDIAEFAPATLNALKIWIDKGGILLRFGGKRMADAPENILTPVTLKTGLRSLTGDMTWTKPAHLAIFPETSPFAGQAVPDVTVERQLLAQPGPELAARTWANLSDGTPFITARTQGRGMIVLVHATATPDWSDFVLSGFYVNFLKELIDLTAIQDKTAAPSRILRPVLSLDGWGRLQSPPDTAKSILSEKFKNTIPSRDHPPGLYSDGTRTFALNIGDRIPPLSIIDSVPAKVKTESLAASSMSQKDLFPYFLTFGLLLFLIDWMLLSVLRRFAPAMSITLLMIFFTFSPAKAENDISRAGVIHLACVKSSADNLCLKAMEKISATLRERTSVETGAPVIIDPARDDLSFYPLLYWPVDTSQNIDAPARARISYYLSHGGMILIDTLDGAYEKENFVPSPNVRHMRDMLSGMNIPALTPAPENFVLFRSFYLLNIRPEYALTGKFWVAEAAASGDADISPVMITGEDWMHRLAYPTDAQSDEMAKRFGINLVMYALTGNYKADQIHMKAILERMGHE